MHKSYANTPSYYVRDLSICRFWSWGQVEMSWNQFSQIPREDCISLGKQIVLRGAGLHLHQQNFHSCLGLVSLRPPSYDNAKRSPVLPKYKFYCLLSFQGFCSWDNLVAVLHSQCLSVHEGISINV